MCGALSRSVFGEEVNMDTVKNCTSHSFGLVLLVSPILARILNCDEPVLQDILVTVLKHEVETGRVGYFVKNEADTTRVVGILIDHLLTHRHLPKKQAGEAFGACYSVLEATGYPTAPRRQP